MKRRHFIAAFAGAGAMESVAKAWQTGNSSLEESEAEGLSSGRLPRASSAGTLKGEMLYRPLGRTGEHVSAIGLGGSHIAKPAVEEAESIRLIHQAVDRGLTFMDNSWDYNQGQSEIRMGKALAQDGYRHKVFLMTKVDGRTKEAAKAQLETSLSRLKTDHVDLLQHHEVIRFEDPDRIFAEGGAMEAFVEAKREGKVRYIGFTGHKDPRVHLYMLAVATEHGFHFDTAQMPLNLMDAHFRSFARLVVPVLVRERVGVLGMKPMGGASGVILESHTVTGLECLHYALNLPTSVVITGIDNQRALDQAFQAVRNFHLLGPEHVEALVAKTDSVAAAGKYELYKTSAHFDSTAHHPDWLGGENPEVQSLAPQPVA